MNFVEEETPLVLVLQMNSILLPFQDSSETVIISGDEVHDIPSANFAISSLTSEDEIRDQASQSEISGELLLQVDERNSRDVSPDKIEMNPDILKAELAFYASPRTEAYENAVYSTLKNIELTCANDFTTFCGISPMAASSFELLAPMPLNSALFYSNSFIVQGMPTVTNGEPIYTDENEMLTIENPRNLRGKNGLNHRQLFDFFSSNGRSNDRLDVVTAQPGVFEAFDRDHEHHMEPGGDHPDHPAPKGPDEDHRDHPGSGGPDGDHHHPGDHQHHDHPGPGGPDDGHMGPPSPYEDDNDEDYLPSLGYGDEGDMCMLSNFVKLSPNCQSAVNDLLYLRQQYMVEESHGRHGHGPHGPISPLVVLWFPVFGILTLVVGVIYRNRLARNRKYKEDTRTMLAAIEANPALKAQLGIYVTFPMMVIISFLVAIFGSMGQYDNRTLLIFMVCMFLQMTIAAYGVSRIRAATALANTGSVSGTTNERHGSGPSAPALATAFFMQSPTVRSGGGVRKMEADADSAAAAICTTTTTTTVTAPLSMLASIKKAFDGIAAGFTAPSAADGGYSSLSSDISVHDSPSPMNIVTGVPVPAPFTAEQQGTTNWI